MEIETTSLCQTRHIFRQPIEQSERFNQSLKILQEEFTFFEIDGVLQCFCSINCMIDYVEDNFTNYLFCKSLPLLHKIKQREDEFAIKEIDHNNIN
jgi:hypothetical protein